jgi:outer membrane protein OmpA-like peptidoglycan-associated protein
MDSIAPARGTSPAAIGYYRRAAPVSAPRGNDVLSLRRAQKIREDLVKLGVPAEQIQVAGRGEREPLVAIEDEVAEPRKRRVEISVR